MAAISLILIVQKNFKLLTPKVWVSGFPSVHRNEISVLATMKKLINGCHFVNIDHMEKFQITDPPQSLGLQFSFLSVDGNGISSENWRCKFSFF